MKQPLILALDIGSSSVRAVVYDGNADLIPSTGVQVYRTFMPGADGTSELNTDAAVAEVEDAIDGVLEKTKRLKLEIAYVATCSFWHSLVSIDAKGAHGPVVFGWADTRSRVYTPLLKKRFDEAAVHNRTGARFHSSYWPAKLMRIRKEFSEIFAGTAYFLSFTDLLGLRFFGELATSVSMASGTGIFDIRKCAWDNELLRFLKLKPSMLPEMVADGHTFRLSKAYAKRWPQLASAEWFPPIGDGAADNIGAGCTTRSKAALMVGTSAAMRVAYEGNPPKVLPSGLWCYRVDRRRVVVGGALSDGGSLHQWLKATLKLPNDAEQQIANRKPGEHGLTFIPFLAGERSTGYNEDATGSIHGLTTSTDTVDIFQAALESVGYRFAEILKQLSRVVKVREIVASGGALRDSPVWTQIIADILGRDLTINASPESSSRGAVLLALESIGKIDAITTLPTANAARAAYDPGGHKIYTRAREQHQSLYKDLSEQEL